MVGMGEPAEVNFCYGIDKTLHPVKQSEVVITDV